MQRTTSKELDPAPGPPAAQTPIHAITFDVGGTLIAPWPSVGHVYAQVAAQHGWKGLPPERLNRQFAKAWRQLQDFRHTRTQWAELVDASFHGLIDIPPSQTFFPEIYERFAAPEAWRIFEDVVPTLSALAERGVRLGVISNWDERLRPLLRRINLIDYFEVVTVSCEVGSPKPARAIFADAARALSLPPGAILHVGDSEDMDVRGARGAGMQAVQIHRAVPTTQRDQIASLRELCQLQVPSDLINAPQSSSPWLQEHDA